jgi:nucleotide-binding universal stress UspA family protein
MFHPRLVLCPTDLSENAASALKTGLDLARQYGATLLLLHVADSLGPEKLSFAEITSQLQPQAHVHQLEDRLRRELPSGAGVPLRYLLREGDPVAEINRAAREHNCDLIVLGTHGRRGIDHLLMGSIAERVVRTAPCPVLVLKYSHGAHTG